jgi:uncharacterized protein YndB with AHSA1/START domain
MTEHSSNRNRAPITFERTYEAAIEDLWALWTTKQGFESWWGPEGFRVEVRALEARAGGALEYDMIADGAEQVAYMKREGMPLSHAVRGTFVEVDAPKRLKLKQIVDFVPGAPSYDNHVLVDLVAEGRKVRMTITVDAHHDEAWTQRAAAGWTSQLTKLPAALASKQRSSAQQR